MVRIWALTLVLCVSPALGAGIRYQDREEGGDADIQLNTRSAMIQFIIHKGCDYVSSYVWSHYMKQGHDPGHVNHQRFVLVSPNCDWTDPVNQSLAAAHVPVELVDALISCGPADSFHAVQIRGWKQLFSNCNMSVNEGHRDVMIAEVDKRGLESETRSGMAMEQALKMYSKISRSEQQFATLDTSGLGDSWLASDHIVQSDSLMKWCRSYSRRVNIKFHLDRVRFVRTSPHWLVDVYKMAKRFSTPISYIHGLVGCGQKYALDAFGVPKRISLLYSSD